MQNKILDHYGYINQMEKLKEELEELSCEIDAVISGRPYKLSSLIGEIADVENVIDQIKSEYKINNEVKVIKHEKCERQLKRMDNEMQDTQEMQVEMDNTAQQVESLAGSALTMSERDIESAIDVEWNGEGFPPLGIECVFTPDNTCWGFNYVEAFTGTVIHYEGEQFVFMLNHKKYNLEDSNLVISRTDKGEFSLPLTPEQKQAQIDEKNGELLYSLVAKVLWDTLGRSTPSYSSDADNKYYEELAKQIDFPGKIKD